MASSREIILDEENLDRLLDSWIDEIVENVKEVENLAVVGIRTRGVPLGKRIRDTLENETDRSIPFGILDITLYRDDLSRPGARPNVKGTEFMFDIDKKNILLVDDVLFTGRTIRAAMNEIFDFGRPASVKLAVLVDRGYRELPIRPDYVGKKLEVDPNHMVRLKLEEVDGTHCVIQE